MKWVTRERARVDRIACPWLITRFVDAKPEFLFVPANRVRDVADRENAIPYDIPEVELGHHGTRVGEDGERLFARFRIERHVPQDLLERRLDAEQTEREPRVAEQGDRRHQQVGPRAVRQARRPKAKSVVGAAHFRRLAAKQGLAIDAVAAGTEPDAALAAGAVKGLAAEGLTATPGRPRSVTLYDLDSAMRVVSFGCDIAAAKGQPIDQWDVPAVSDGYAAARDRIVANVERLVADLTAQR